MPPQDSALSTQHSSRFHRHRHHAALAAVLVLSSIAGLSLVAFRFYYSGRTGYGFMRWNLFLAWIPLLLALAMESVRKTGRGGRATLLALGALWLLFFPNAPYLLTEFIHLHRNHAVIQRPIGALSSVTPGGEIPVWYDAVLILTFAWNGLLLGFVSLHLVQRAVRESFGAACGWAAAVAVLCLSAFGVSLGRFERWNSWDLFARPLTLLADVAARVFNPFDYARTTAVTVLLSAFLLLAYLSIAALAAAMPPRDATAPV